jgi:hypothetical protein
VEKAGKTALIPFNWPLKNVFEAADTRQKQAKSAVYA